MFLDDCWGRLASRYTMSVVVHAYTQYPRNADAQSITPVHQGAHVSGRKWSEVLRIQSTTSGQGMMLMSQYSLLGDLYQHGMRAILW